MYYSTQKGFVTRQKDGSADISIDWHGQLIHSCPVSFELKKKIIKTKSFVHDKYRPRDLI